MFARDKIAQSILGSDFDAFFSKKNSQGEYDKKPINVNTGKDIEPLIPNIKKVIRYIIDELEKGKGTQFDPEIAEAMIQLVKEDSEYMMKGV